MEEEATLGRNGSLWGYVLSPTEILTQLSLSLSPFQFSLSLSRIEGWSSRGREGGRRSLQLPHALLTGRIRQLPVLRSHNRSWHPPGEGSAAEPCLRAGRAEGAAVEGMRDKL